MIMCLPIGQNTSKLEDKMSVAWSSNNWDLIPVKNLGNLLEIEEKAPTSKADLVFTVE